MADRISTWLRLSIAVLVFTSYMGLGTTFRYSQMSMLVPITVILAMPIGEWLDRRFAAYRKLTNLTTLAMMLFLPLLALQSGLMDTVITLFIYIQIYSLAHEKKKQEYYHVILMCFFLLIAALVMSPSAAMGLVLFFFIISGALSILLTDWRNQLIESTPVVPDRRVSQRTGPNETRKPFRMIPAMSLLILLIFGLTSVLFVFMPRTQAGLLGRSVPTEIYTTGLSDGVLLNVNGSIASDSSPVMRVQFSNGDGQFAGDKYWRSTTMDKYEGTNWSRQGLSTRIGNNDAPRLNFRTAPSTFGVNNGVARRTMSRDWPEIEYEVFVDSYPEGGFPLLSTAVQVAPKHRTRNLRLYWEQGGDFTVNLNYRNELKPYFLATSQIIEPTPDQLRQSGDIYMDVMVPSDYRLLTEHNLEPRTLALIEELIVGAGTAYDKVVAIERHFGSVDFEYTREVPALDPERPVESFIHDVRIGHCELYASAMALMVRSEGIPARVVSGYRGGDWDKSDKSYTITNNMAHLWVEIYFPDYGWITFDPTPSDDEIERTALQHFMNTLARYSLKARIYWLQYVVGFSPAESFTFFRDQAFQLIRELFASEEDEVQGIGKITWPDGTRGVLLGLFTFVLVGCGVLMVRLGLRALKKPKAMVLQPDQLRARRLYAQLRAALIRLQLAEGNETAEELATRLSAFPEEIKIELERFVACYHDARFGLRPLSTQDYNHFRALIRNLKAIDTNSDRLATQQ